ncbi:Intradiol ring-cleavage dioxygenase [Dichotomopilus funicola]|uniref:Intradiol ring-cleavage dioxygenase n=1 Tax=Dichotomopilus funicola TaxID=1934379 RepID=A0AAN6V062_9PEZI|nr:Intradiol ring-cleavage dioxygenase [Dichotomopilus funicola]
MLLTKALTGLTALAGLVAAHPGHSVAQEAAELRAYMQSVKRTSLAHCADKLEARGHAARNVARRQAAVNKARTKRGLKKRNIDEVLATDHNKTTLAYTPETDPKTLFSGYNSCLLAPEVTQGPYYVAGEYIRHNVVEDQPGVPLLLDYQVIDVDTCEPVPSVYLEIWHCNSTGVYAGVAANGNGNTADDTNIDQTWLRGIQLTNGDGVAQFESVFPGHYTGRTPHIHVMVHATAGGKNGTVQANNTLGLDNYSSHVGQSFFDQTLISAVELTEPYASNTQPLTTNAEDGIMSQSAEGDGVDPVMEYTLLGNSIEDGLFAWFSFGVNTTRVDSISPAVWLEEGGGVANPDAGGGGGPGGPGGFPSGGFPSGFPSGGPTSSAAATSTAAAKCRRGE